MMALLVITGNVDRAGGQLPARTPIWSGTAAL